MFSRIDLGVRHILPIYPFLAVVAGIEYGRVRLLTRFAGWLLAAWPEMFKRAIEIREDILSLALVR